MAARQRPAVYFHLHLISDATGETLNAVSRATCAQFEDVKPIEHVYALVRSRRQLDRVLKEIEDAPGLVLYTLMSEELRATLEKTCQTLGILCLSVLDPVLAVMGNYLGTELTHKAGGQHQMDAEYFRRIEALNYTMSHDDGQNAHELNDADVVLLGVSRTSKTPTCIYLANRGVKAANIPLVKDVPLPTDLDAVTEPLIVGLTISSERLIQIRRQRLIAMEANTETSYVDEEEVRKEILFARRLFDRYDCPTIDVSRKSIEETAAGVITLLSRRTVEEAVNPSTPTTPA